MITSLFTMHAHCVHFNTFSHHIDDGAWVDVEFHVKCISIDKSKTGLPSFSYNKSACNSRNVVFSAPRRSINLITCQYIMFMFMLMVAYRLQLNVGCKLSKASLPLEATHFTSHVLRANQWAPESHAKISESRKVRKTWLLVLFLFRYSNQCWQTWCLLFFFVFLFLYFTHRQSHYTFLARVSIDSRQSPLYRYTRGNMTFFAQPTPKCACARQMATISHQ